VVERVFEHSFVANELRNSGIFCAKPTHNNGGRQHTADDLRKTDSVTSVDR